MPFKLSCSQRKELVNSAERMNNSTESPQKNHTKGLHGRHTSKRSASLPTLIYLIFKEKDRKQTADLLRPTATFHPSILHQSPSRTPRWAPMKKKTPPLSVCREDLTEEPRAALREALGLQQHLRMTASVKGTFPLCSTRSTKHWRDARPLVVLRSLSVCDET